jgi:TonB family protein
LGVDETGDDDEEVVFEGGGETIKDNPAFWGSSETKAFEAPSSPSAPAGEETIGAPRAGGDWSPAETRTVTPLPPTSVEPPAANITTRVAQSVARHVPTSVAAVRGVWEQRRGVVAAVGGGLVLILALAAVWTLSTPGGGTQSESPAPTEEGSLIELPPVATPAPTGLAEPPPGILAIQSDPIGASVLISGAKLGLTPLEISELALGNYTVRLEKAGFEPEELTAELNAESPRATLSVPMRGEARSKPRLAILRVNSTPPGAQVLLDGKPAGSTPLTTLRARPGNRTIRLQKLGFEPWEKKVALKAGGTESISATLEPREKETPAPTPATPKITEGDLVERGADVIDPKCIECPGVRYPEVARRAKLEGSVQISFLVTETGAVEDIRVLQSGGEVFDKAVIDTVKSWRHEPATKNGVRVKVRLTKRFTFRRGN